MQRQSDEEAGYHAKISVANDRADLRLGSYSETLNELTHLLRLRMGFRSGKPGN